MKRIAAGTFVSLATMAALLPLGLALGQNAPPQRRQVPGLAAAAGAARASTINTQRDLLMRRLEALQRSAVAQHSQGSQVNTLRRAAKNKNAIVDSNSVITTIAGGGTPSGAATAVEISAVQHVVSDPGGSLFIGAPGYNQALKVDASGNISAVAGTGSFGNNVGSGSATQTNAGLYYGAAEDTQGNLYFSDLGNEEIVELVAATGNLQVVAGNGTSGYSGDGGPATQAQLYEPFGVAVDSQGNVYIADSFNYVIREVTASTGIINTVAGNPGFPFFNGNGIPALQEGMFPFDVSVDSHGNYFIADVGNCIIYEVTAATGLINAVAGQATFPPTCGEGADDGELATQALLVAPEAVLVDSSEDFYIGDGSGRVREVNGSNQVINTVAGQINAPMPFCGDGGPATSACLNGIAGLAKDSSGNLYISDSLNVRVRKVAASTQTITTFAGGGSDGNGGPATSALIPSSSSLALDSSNNVYFGENYAAFVRQVNASTGIISAYAGQGIFFNVTEGATALNTYLIATPGLAFDPSSNLYLTQNPTIQQISAAAGTISDYAGSLSASMPYCGDGGPATQACLNDVQDVVTDSAGNVFIADFGNCVVREVNALTGIISTVAGVNPGPYMACGLSSGDGGPAVNAVMEPSAVFVDASDNLYITDLGGNAIRMVNAQTGTINTVAGVLNATPGFSGDGGPATQAGVSVGFGRVVLDSAGDIFIPDSGNNRIRFVDGQTQIITTLAGSTASGNGGGSYCGDGGPAGNACLDGPAVLVLDSAGNLYINDGGNNRIREILISTAPVVTLSPTGLTYASQVVGTTSDPQTVTVTNTGTGVLSITSIAIAGDNMGDFAQTNTCGTSVAAGASCTISATFTPSATGARSASVTLTDNASDSPQTIGLSGMGADFSAPVVAPTSLTLTAGQTGMIAATVTSVGGFAGTVTVTCTGAPVASTCTPSPASLTLTSGSSATSTVTVTTTARGLLPPSGSPRAPADPLTAVPALAMGVLAGLFFAMRRTGRMDAAMGRRLAGIGLASVLLWVSLLAACGGSTGSITTGTPAGNYTLTITAVSGSTTQSTPVVLTVQ